MSHTGDWIGGESVHKYRTPWAHRRGKEQKTVLYQKVRGDIGSMKKKVSAQEHEVFDAKKTMSDNASPQAIQEARATLRRIFEDMHMHDLRCVERTCM